MYGNRRIPPFLNGSRSFILLCLLVPFFVACAYPADTVTSTVIIGTSRIDVSTEEGALHAPKEDVMKWMQWSAEAVAGYYGRFPVPHTSLRIIPTSGAGVRGGRTWGDRGSHISIHVGADTTWSDFADDWMLTHEMIHLAFPDVDDQHHWIEEGISVYVEPFARVRAHHMDANQMWFEVVRDMPKGLPGPGDQGLDRTHTWGRTYWGGALFSFLADVQIHQKTQNQKGFESALRGILAAGGNISEDWPLERALRAGDEASGTRVLEDLYKEMADKPVTVDLPNLWRELGIQRSPDGDVSFVDDAPLASVRKSITAGPDSR